MEPVKEGHRSGSYDDKKNTLMKTAGFGYGPIGQDDRVWPGREDRAWPRG
jgi:hypothetical protein